MLLGHHKTAAGNGHNVASHRSDATSSQVKLQNAAPDPTEVQKSFSQKISSMDMGVSKNRGFSPKMDGENNGKPYFFNG